MRTVVYLMFCSVLGCHTVSGTPATLDQPTDETWIVIGKALEKATGRYVLVDGSAFADSGTMYVTMHGHKSIGRTFITGRVMPKHMRFDLVLRDGQCELHDGRTSQHFVLDGVACSPIAP